MKNNKSQKNIPDGWQDGKLGDFLNKIEGGGTPSKLRLDFWNGSIPWASVKDVVTHSSNDTQDHISEVGLKNSSSRLVLKGTLIVPTRMALGHAVFFNVDVAINQDLKALYPKKELQKKFLFYWFEDKKGFIKRLGIGSTVDGIQQNELKAIKFNLPSLSEQNRIVGVLETWDQMIEKLSKKIKIKKNIKKGLMQNLLTGKIRLSGFNDKWKVRILGDIAKMSSGGTPKSTVPEYYGGDMPWVSISDMTKNGKYIFKTEKKLTQSGLENCSVKIYPKGTILYAMYASIGACGIAGTEMSSSQAILGIISNKKELDGMFLYFYLTHLRDKIKLQGQQGAQSNLNAGMVKDFKINLPNIKEQSAIVNILNISDEEIKVIKKKLSILKDQKKYLLNNLITGKIRIKQ